MKIVIKTVLIFLLIADFFYPGYCRDITPEMLKDKGVLVITVGNDETLCVINTDYENGAYWFLITGLSGNRALGHNLSSLAEVHQLLPSLEPGGRYLAVLSVGEGHPVVEVVDLPKLLDKNEYTVRQVLDPYPGTIEIDRWENSNLIVTSTAPLTQRKKDGRVDPDQLLPVAKKYSLNVGAGTIEELK